MPGIESTTDINYNTRTIIAITTSITIFLIFYDHFMIVIEVYVLYKIFTIS